MSQNDSPEPVTVGNNLTYTVTVTNNSPVNAADNVVLTDNLPAGVTVVSANSSQGTVTVNPAGTGNLPRTAQQVTPVSPSAITANLGTILPNSSVVTTIVVTPRAAGLINNNVSVSTSSSDPNLANNSASETTAVNQTPTPTPTFNISGSTVNDINRNGIQDSGELGIANVTTFIDANNDGLLNPGELSAVTNANGNFLFTLSPGNYAVREIVPSGFTTTTANPVNVNLTNSNATVFFGNTSETTVVNPIITPTPTPTFNISGSTVNDINRNGIQDSGELGTANVTTFIDANNDGLLNPGELSAVTNANGNFLFTLSPGNYAVREIVPSGFTTTTANPVNVNLTNSNATVFFGNTSETTVVNPIITPTPTPTFNIRGSTVNDINRNGIQDSGELGIANVTTFIDANNDGLLNPGELSAVTNANGNFLFTLSPGNYAVREIVPSGFTTTTANPVNVNLTNSNATVFFGNTSETTVVNPIITPTPTPTFNISGSTVNDINRNGIQDSGELGIANVTTFIDANNDGLLNPGELSAVTNANGNFLFTLSPGNYAVREIVPSGFTTTTANPVNVNLTNSNATVFFGNTSETTVVNPIITPTPTPTFNISGSTVNDINRNGIQDSGELGIANVTTFIDANNDGLLNPGELSAVTNANGNFLFTLSPGNYAVREIVPSGFTTTTANPVNVNLTNSNATVFFGNTSETTVVNPIITPTPTPTFNIRGSTVNDINRNGIQDSGELGIANVTTFIDANNDGLLNPGELSAVTNANGNFLFTLSPGNYAVREIVPSGFTTTTANPVNVNLTNSNATVFFGNTSETTVVNPIITPTPTPTFNISGSTVNDINRNGIQDSGELGIANVTTFIDANNDGLLNPGELSAVTNANGNFLFTLSPGNYAVREIVPSGFTTTTANPVNVNLTNSNATVFFGNTSETTVVNPIITPTPTPTFNISGSTVNDINRNGIQDSGELGIANVTTFIDANNDGLLNPGELSAVTNANGNFLFTLSPGNYAVREIVPSGFTTTTANPVNVNLTNSDVTLFFGNAATTPTPTITASSINTLTNKGVDNDTLIGSNSAGIPKDFSSDDLFLYSPNQTKDIAADIVAGSDRIFVSSVGFGNLIPGAISPNQFAWDTAALDINVRFIYDRPNGSLFYDPDGGALHPKYN